MLGGAPEAHEVLSKTPRGDVAFNPKCPSEAFPIKASDKPGLGGFINPSAFIGINPKNGWMAYEWEAIEKQCSPNARRTGAICLLLRLFLHRAVTCRRGRYVLVKFSLWQKVVLPGTKWKTVQARKLA